MVGTLIIVDAVREARDVNKHRRILRKIMSPSNIFYVLITLDMRIGPYEMT